MRIVVDGQLDTLGVPGGIRRYHDELSTSLRLVAGAEVIEPRHLPRNLRFGATARLRIPRSVSTIANLAADAIRTADLFHATFYVESWLRLYRRRPFVVTIHDMLPEQHPAWFPRGNPHMSKQKYFDHAAGVIFVSSTTRDAAYETWGQPDCPSRVVHLAASRALQKGRRDFSWRRPFVLYVGPRWGYKGFGTLVCALGLLGSARDIDLLCVGGGPFTAEEEASLMDAGIRERAFQFFLDDGNLGAAYEAAQALVYPSLGEGFGLPVVEALAAGCAPVLADTAIAHEVGGPESLYFRPGSAEHLAELLESVGHDADASIRVSRQRRAEQFSWSRSARETYELYEAALAYSQSRSIRGLR